MKTIGLDSMYYLELKTLRMKKIIRLNQLTGRLRISKLAHKEIQEEDTMPFRHYEFEVKGFFKNTWYKCKYAELVKTNVDGSEIRYEFFNPKSLVELNVVFGKDEQA